MKLITRIINPVLTLPIVSTIFVPTIVLSSCSEKVIELKNIGLTKETSFGGIMVNLSNEQLNTHNVYFGDSVDLYFSNGQVIKNVPYFNGYYVKNRTYVFISYNNANPMLRMESVPNDWERLKIKEGDTVTLKIRKNSTYKEIFDCLNIGNFSNNREDFSSDIEFANFRQLNSKVRPIFYRGASPIDDKFKRSNYADQLCKEKGVTYDLNISDTKIQVDQFVVTAIEEGRCQNFIDNIYTKNQMTCVGANIGVQSAREKYVTLARAIIAGRTGGKQEIFYIHCTEGKDRTGIFCTMLESLAGCTYEEMFKEYVQTYINLYKLDLNKDAKKIEWIRRIFFNNLLRELSCNIDQTVFTTEDILNATIAYLCSGDNGLSTDEILELVKIVNVDE